MLKIILVDDEDEGLDVLEYDLGRLQIPLKIVGKYNDPQEALIAIQTAQPDLLFLDIEMPWMNGFELLDQVGEIDFRVIFVTAYDQYAIRAFRYFAVDYLLKPVDIKHLREAVERVTDSGHKISSSQIKALIDQLHVRNEPMTRIAIPTSGGFEFIEISSIVRCQADNNYAIIYLVDGKKLLVSKPLKYLHDLLESHRFFRTHQSHLVNLDHVAKFVKADGGYAQMVDGSIVNIARGKKEQFVSLFRGLNN